MNWIKIWSIIINRFRLLGKWVHLYRIRKAKEVLKKIVEISSQEYGYPKSINYLKKINPFVFEELILNVIQDTNVHIIRNKSYSNDGGIDGKFKIKQGKVLIQCKRYKNYINNKDVLDLAQKVKDGKYYYGVFAHTGKTGERSKNIVKEHQNIVFISGSLLIDLLLKKKTITAIIEQKTKYQASKK